MTWLTKLLNHFSPITPTVQYKTPQSYPAQSGNKRRSNEFRKRR